MLLPNPNPLHSGAYTHLTSCARSFYVNPFPHACQKVLGPQTCLPPSLSTTRPPFHSTRSLSLLPSAPLAHSLCSTNSLPRYSRPRSLTYPSYLTLPLHSLPRRFPAAHPTRSTRSTRPVRRHPKRGPPRTPRHRQDRRGREVPRLRLRPGARCTLRNRVLRVGVT